MNDQETYLIERKLGQEVDEGVRRWLQAFSHKQLVYLVGTFNIEKEAMQVIG